MNYMVLGIIVLLMYLTGMLVAIQLKKDTSLGNFTWGVGVVLITLYTFFLNDIHNARSILITTLIVLWGIRLAVFFYSRYKKGSDPRFISWQHAGGFYAFLKNFIWIFIGQNALLLIMSLPALLVNRSSLSGLNWLDFIAVGLWLIGFYFETIGDYQLYTFMHNPANKGKIMNQGLWHYTRHPNYFGEITMWWAIFLIALSVPYGIYALIAPLTITILLRYITGVPMLEAVFKDNVAYQEYKRRTNMLIPWWPKK